jgi:dienelactone hydrolase
MVAMRITLALVLALAAAACFIDPAPVIPTGTVEYVHGRTVLEGYLAEPPGTFGDLPAVLVVHAWKGIRDHERDWAERLARRGYVVLVADIYGKGVRPETREEAAKQAGKYRADRALLRSRARAGLERLKAHDRVDPERTAAIGFCFGGGAVLELARSGAELAGVVSLHGNLDTPDPDDAKSIVARVLVLHGAADPHVPAEQVRAFEAPAAGDDPSRGAAYDEEAAGRAWEATLAFLRELF